jgi:AcrR family transcriptional regulator
MRKLAQELGVEAMSLYHHVVNKDEILDGLERALGDQGSGPGGRPQ